MMNLKGSAAFDHERVHGSSVSNQQKVVGRRSISGIFQRAKSVIPKATSRLSFSKNHNRKRASNGGKTDSDLLAALKAFGLDDQSPSTASIEDQYAGFVKDFALDDQSPSTASIEDQYAGFLAFLCHLDDSDPDEGSNGAC